MLSRASLFVRSRGVSVRAAYPCATRFASGAADVKCADKEEEIRRLIRSGQAARAVATQADQSASSAPSTGSFPVGEGARIVTVTSGKGGVGKTTTAASFAYGLAEAGFKTVAIDFDIGLRNLDLHLGMERRVIFDFVNVINGECSLKQALIKDRRNPNLHLLAASQTRDKDALTPEGVEGVLADLKPHFDYIICDSPAGIEAGAFFAMYYADDAIVVTNPEVSSVRDSDKMLGILNSKSYRAVHDLDPVKPSLLVTRYVPETVEDGTMLPVNEIAEMLGIPVVGLVPESPEVLKSSNLGQPVICERSSDASVGYTDMVKRFMGEELELKFTTSQPKGFFSRMFK